MGEENVRVRRTVEMRHLSSFSFFIKGKGGKGVTRHARELTSS